MRRFLTVLLLGLFHLQAWASETVKPSGGTVALPEIGKWMMAPDSTPASWLGQKYRGKSIREPINVILVDGFAKSPEAANERLISACKKAEITTGDHDGMAVLLVAKE